MHRQSKHQKWVNWASEKMQVLCLDPRKSIFDEINRCENVKKEEGTNYNVWYISAYSAHPEWNEYSESEQSKKNDVEFINYKMGLKNKIKKYCTKSNIENIWYMYCATGHKEYIDWLNQISKYKMKSEIYHYYGEVLHNMTLMYLDVIQENLELDEFFYTNEKGERHEKFKDLYLDWVLKGKKLNLDNINIIKRLLNEKIIQAETNYIDDDLIQSKKKNKKKKNPVKK